LSNFSLKSEYSIHSHCAVWLLAVDPAGACTILLAPEFTSLFSTGKLCIMSVGGGHSVVNLPALTIQNHLFLWYSCMLQVHHPQHVIATKVLGELICG